MLHYKYLYNLSWTRTSEQSTTSPEISVFVIVKAEILLLAVFSTLLSMPKELRSSEPEDNAFQSELLCSDCLADGCRMACGDEILIGL